LLACVTIEQIKQIAYGSQCLIEGVSINVFTCMRALVAVLVAFIDGLQDSLRHERRQPTECLSHRKGRKVFLEQLYQRRRRRIQGEPPSVWRNVGDELFETNLRGGYAQKQRASRQLSWLAVPVEFLEAVL
jgi:hypothetical protein